MMTNNTTPVTTTLEVSNMGLRELKITQEKFHKSGQTASRGNYIQTPIPCKEHSLLGVPVASDPNVISERFSSGPERGRLRGSLDAYVKTCQRWKLEPDKQMILLGYEPHDAFGRHVLCGDYIPPSRDFRDRIAYVLRISLGLGSVFNEAVEAELNWLNKARTELNDKSAFDYMLEGHMSNLFIIADLVEYERGL